MTTIGDLFGTAPGRPDHPDFWRLSEILLQFDGRSQSNEAEMPQMVQEILSGGYADARSLVYTAGQRSQHVVNEMGLPPQMLPALTILYFEAFLVGSEFRKRQDVDRIEAESEEHAKIQLETGDPGRDIRFHDGLAHAREIVRGA